jgi:D-glycero-alpha-D-manno-heptose-7-phosphate kinase
MDGRGGRGAALVIISRTPFRVSLAGGGSDIPAYYRHTPGNVVSMAINRYMYVTVNRRFDDQIRVSYTRTEIVNRIDEIQHDLIREALRMTGVACGVEITTIADLPAGIGLGSSSSLTVGVLNALAALKGEHATPEELARRACQIEIDVLGRPIGKQDQYIAAFGGLQDLQFRADETVNVTPVFCSREHREALVQRLMLFYTGVHRDAGAVLGEVRANLDGADTRARMDCLAAMAGDVRQALLRGQVSCIGRILDRSWALKKRMASTVTNGMLDALYQRALEAGADGGKVSGAGGGGCLLLFVKPAARARVRAAMTRSGLREVPIGFELEGSRIIHYSV